MKRPPFLTMPEGTVGLCGISSGFPKLFPSPRQVTHVLLTRPPLYLQPEGRFRARLACIRHAASVHSEPGSNSPVESCMRSTPRVEPWATSAVSSAFGRLRKPRFPESFAGAGSGRRTARSCTGVLFCPCRTSSPDGRRTAAEESTRTYFLYSVFKEPGSSGRVPSSGRAAPYAARCDLPASRFGLLVRVALSEGRMLVASRRRCQPRGRFFFWGVRPRPSPS